MVITTGPIQIDDGPVLGGYSITYGVQDKNLSIHNNVNPIRDYGLAHPHIYQDGEICFGNYSDIFFRFETGEYYVGLELLHEFLSTYNPEDEWGHRLIYWDAEYVFEDMRERGILNELTSEWDERYYNIYDEHLPCVNTCEDCGEPIERCECHRCQYCGRPEEDCECWICPECGGEVGNDCNCDRCESCNELVGDCECERCDVCEELLDPYNSYSNHCECERCPDDYDIFVDTDEFGCCTECENWDCEHNCNENHSMHQEESLFDELAV
jgi:protocadherin alpha